MEDLVTSSERTSKWAVAGMQAKAGWCGMYSTGSRVDNHLAAAVAPSDIAHGSHTVATACNEPNDDQNSVSCQIYPHFITSLKSKVWKAMYKCDSTTFKHSYFLQ
jgi:hypothetical protein